MLRQKINSRWFAIFDLVCASLSSLAWFYWPESAGWPLILALFPWLLRIGAGVFPFKRTPLDIPLLFFLLTAGLGVWVSYDTAGAWEKFWLLVGAIFIFYALSGQPRSNLPFVSALMAGLGFVVALSLMFDTSLLEYTSDLGFVQRVLLGWVSVRPSMQFQALPPNITGGILAMLLPFPLFFSFDLLRRGRLTSSLISLIPAILMTVALFLSSSRGAWVGIAVAVVVVILLYISRDTLHHISSNFRVILAIIFIACVAFGIRFAIVESMWIANTLDRMPGFPFGAARLDLILNSWNLVADFPFTGAGLRAFPGLYSKYILLIPHLFLEYSHHLYMDILLEQGVVGFLSFIVILYGSLFMVVARFLMNRNTDQTAYMQLAVIAGLVVVSMHGLVDTPLYAVKGTPLLFLLPGIGAALMVDGAPLGIRDAGAPPVLLKHKYISASILLIVPLLLFLGWSSLKSTSSAWYANLGSIYMSKSELRGFPTNSWEALPESEYDRLAQEYFVQALSRDPTNITANYRMGLIASQKEDFATAVSYLEKAYAQNDQHRGIRKALGFNYAWTAQPELAAEMLSEIPEARGELKVYVWWWGTQKRADLASNSKVALDYLPAP